MAELLVMAQDKVNADFYKNCQCYKRGDVVVACPDGWNWGTQEVNNPLFQIVKVPDLDLAEAHALTAMEVDTDPVHPSKTLQKRAFRVDLDALAPHGHNVKAEHIRAAKKQKAPIDDPQVIG